MELMLRNKEITRLNCFICEAILNLKTRSKNAQRR
jgi:hypothetical protein